MPGEMLVHSRWRAAYSADRLQLSSGVRSHLSSMNDELHKAIRRFAARELGVAVERLEEAQTQLGRDLGVDGADGWEFIEAFGPQFGVDISSFESARHFGPEAGPSPLHGLWWSVTRSWPRLVP